MHYYMIVNVKVPSITLKVELKMYTVHIHVKVNKCTEYQNWSSELIQDENVVLKVYTQHTRNDHEK